MSGFTGGRASVEEQRKLGGEADKCPIYDLYLFHFAMEDEYAKRVYDECYKGVRMCGECKQELAAIVKRYLEEHRRKRDSLMKDAEELLKSSRKSLGHHSELMTMEKTPLHPIERKVLASLADGPRVFDALVSSSGLLPDQVRRSISWLASKALVTTTRGHQRRAQADRPAPRAGLPREPAGGRRGGVRRAPQERPRRGPGASPPRWAARSLRDGWR